MRNKKAIALSLVLSLAATAGWAQITNRREPTTGRINSPYSRFGIGSLSENRSIGLRGMGGIANGYSNEHTINAFNPASYSYLVNTAFEFGLVGETNNVRMNETVTNSSTLTLSHLNFAFPIIKRKLAVNLGYLPIANAYYNTVDSSMVDGLGLVRRNYNGQGALNYGFIGISGGLGGFSLGVNAGYMFGNMRNSSYLNVFDTAGFAAGNARVTEVTSRSVYGGMYFKGGAMYRAKLKDNNFLSIGATAALSQRLNNTMDDHVVAGTIGTIVVTDTVSARYGAEGHLVMPAEYGFGLHYGKNNVYNVGVDLNYADWSVFRQFDAQASPQITNSTYRIGIGGEVLPNPKATSKQYFSAVTYRLGAYYGKDHIRINETDVNYYGVTAGLMLPFKPSANSEQHGALNIGMDFGNRGTLDNGLAREFRTRFTIGMKLNASWFVRRKYD